MSDVIAVINIDQIKKLIPHRAPFLLIDRVEHVVLESEAAFSEPFDAARLTDPLHGGRARPFCSTLLEQTTEFKEFPGHRLCLS